MMFQLRIPLQASLPFLFLLLSTSLRRSESSCRRGCDLALGSYYLTSEASNLTYVANFFNQKPTDVLPYNSLSSQDSIITGTRINIGFSCDCISGDFLGRNFSYTAQSSDTYDIIASDHYANLTTAAWLEATNSYPSSNIQIGDLINVIINCSCGDPGVSKDYGLFETYPLRSGETLDSVASEFNLSSQKSLIQQYNPGKDFNAGSGIVFVPTRGDVADDLEETILSKEGLERTCEDNSGNGEKGNDGLYSLVSEWLEDSNFSQLFGDLNERSNVETTNIDVEEVEVNERIYCDDEDDENDVDYEYNSSDDCEEFLESDIEINEDDELFESNVDPSVEFKGTAAKEKEKIAIRKYSEIDCINSSNEVSIEGSEEESNAKWPVFNPRSESETSNLVVGMLFSCKEEFKEVVQNCAIVNGKSIKFVKNDKRRCRVVCRKPNCPFLIYISKHQGSHSWQIRSLQEHTCSWSYHNKTLTSTVIAKKFVNKVRINPQCKTKMFKRQVIDELKLHVSNSQARKALIKAHKLVNIKEEEQFGQIWDYCLEIVRTNPGTTISVQTTTDPDLEGKKSFLRMYVCFDACKRGFLAGCRPIVGVDGCFLKGPQGGQLLTAVTLDGNNNIFPIAWAVVESETRNSWEWFLEHLGKDLQIFEEQYRYTFISDKQKGLIPAFENVFPNVTNRFCVRHLHQNFKLAGFQGIALKNVLWAAARSTTVNQFTHNMEQLAKIDANAYKWLNEKHPGEWSRSHFSYISKCDTLLNNMCECFNAMILEARELPIISIFESIRNLVMTRMQEKKAISMKWSDTICPRIREILGRNLYESGNCIGVKSDDNNYQITTMQGAQYTVDLDSSSCSCRRWELTGLPCTHVCAAINMVELDHDNFVSNYYLVDTYRRTYENNIKPVNGHEEWPKSKREPPLPPKYSKPKRGRPRKLRRSGMDQQPKESQRSNLNISTMILYCSQCKQIGHNSKTCGKKKE